MKFLFSSREIVQTLASMWPITLKHQYPLTQFCKHCVSKKDLSSSQKIHLEICTNLPFCHTRLWNRWETVDFSNSKQIQIWRCCVRRGEVLAKDTTRLNVSVWSCLSLNGLNVWLGLRCVWMREWVWCVNVSGTLLLIPKGVTKCNYFLMMTVLQPVRWAHKIIPVSLRCLLCSHLMYVASRLSAPWRKWNSHLLTKSFFRPNCPALLCHILDNKKRLHCWCNAVAIPISFPSQCTSLCWYLLF